MKHDPEHWRDRFPILESTTYLVNHSLGAMPAAVVDKLRAFTDAWATRGVRAWAEGWWTSPMDVGNVLGRLMNAPPGSVVMHQNVSVIQALVASCLDFSGKRNKIVYTDQEFPSNMYVWEGMRARGARIETVPTTGVEVDMQRLLAAIDETTLIVPLSPRLPQDALPRRREGRVRAREGGRRPRPPRRLPGARHGSGRRPVARRRHGLRRLGHGCAADPAPPTYVRPDLLPKLEPGITGWAAHEEPSRVRDRSPALRARHPAHAPRHAVRRGVPRGDGGLRDPPGSRGRRGSRVLIAMTEGLRGKLGAGFRVSSLVDPAKGEHPGRSRSNPRRMVRHS
jgi:kynureninase